MRLSALIAPMIAAGVDGETILKTVLAYEDQQESEIEQRRANDRERQRKHRGNVMSRDVTVTERDTPLSDKEKSPTPPKEINSPPVSSLRSEPKKGTRLAIDFKPDFEFAAGEGFSHSEALTEAMKFRDYWISKPGKDGTKLDWPATWRNWIRNASARRPSNQNAKRESNFAKHQRECTEALERSVYGEKTDDQFTSNGAAFDLEPGNWRPH